MARTRTSRPAITVAALVLAGCASAFPVLHSGEEIRNELPRYANARVCIHGKISNDNQGVYFLLEPYESEGVITPSPSRVQVGGGINSVRALRDGNTYTVCGTLRETTPWRVCNDTDCKWYTLDQPRLG